MDQLRSLKDIYDNGFITRDEFQQRKSLIIDQMTGTQFMEEEVLFEMKKRKSPIQKSKNGSLKKSKIETEHTAKKSSRPVWRQVSKEKEDDHCICGLGWNRDRSFMLACDNCSSWFHGKCIGFSCIEVIPDKWYCKRCEKYNEEDEDIDVDGDDDDLTVDSIILEQKDSTNPNQRKLSWNQYANAAEKILQREKRPMSYRELTEIAVQEKMLISTSSTPSCSMSSALSTHANKGIKFRRVSTGVYALLEDNHTALTDVQQSHLPFIKRFRLNDQR